MTEIGQIALIVALVIAAYSAVAMVVGARRRLPELARSGRLGVLVVCGLTTLAAVALW